MASAKTFERWLYDSSGPLLPLLTTSDISPMSSTSDTTSTTSNFQAIFEVALNDYTKKTGKDLCSLDHPLTSKLDSCDSPDSILNIFQEQAREFDEFRKGDTKLFKWLKPIVKVLYTLSTNNVLQIGDRASSVNPRNIYSLIMPLTLYPKVFPPANAVFSAIQTLLYVRFSLLISANSLITSKTVRRPRT